MAEYIPSLGIACVNRPRSKRIASQANLVMVVLIAGVLALAPAIAAQPSWAGAGKGEKGEQKGKHENSTVRQGEYFGDQHRVVVNEYYGEQFRSGKCPPGLAKKHNGCMPPGQAKKWAIGRPLPRDVVLYEVPQELVVKIGIPPAGYRYARVANDILLIAAGTGMVIDAIQDLGRK
jgi:Ni/Co efflux regulator RcnB